MRFQVPQFIEVEDKIFGPLTFKQFIYIAGGAGICVILLTFLPRFIALILSVPVAVFSGSLAFYRINGKPFASIVEAAVKYVFGPRLYIWKKTERTPIHSASAPQTGETPQIYVPKLSQSKLKDLAWELDIQENENPTTK